MNSFRARWPDRLGFIVAIVGVSLGLGVMRRSAGPLDGVQLIMWLATLALVVLPLLIIELGVGVVFQNALAECCRKANRHCETLGWLGAGLAYVALVLGLVAVGGSLVSAYDSALAALANQALPGSGPRSDSGPVILAIAALVALIDRRLWRGAPCIARTAQLVVPAGLVGLAALIVVFASRPGACDGLALLLGPGPGGWGRLLDASAWLMAIGQGVAAWLVGLGLFAAFGSYLNRASDVTAMSAIAVCAAGLCQLVMVVVTALAIGLTGGALPLIGAAAVHPEGPVPFAIVGLGGTPWILGWLATVWFAVLVAFALPALLALAEAVVAPLIDKFHLPRERAVASVCMTAFFAAALLAALPVDDWQGRAEVVLAGAAALLLAAQAAFSYRAADLPALQRHLNAYSAFSLAWPWRAAVAVALPLLALLSGLQMVRLLPAALEWWVVAGAVLLASVAWVIARLPARGL